MTIVKTARPGIPELIASIRRMCTKNGYTSDTLTNATGYTNARALLSGELVTVTQETEYLLREWLKEEQAKEAPANVVPHKPASTPLLEKYQEVERKHLQEIADLKAKIKRQRGKIRVLHEELNGAFKRVAAAHAAAAERVGEEDDL